MESYYRWTRETAYGSIWKLTKKGELECVIEGINNVDPFTSYISYLKGTLSGCQTWVKKAGRN